MSAPRRFATPVAPSVDMQRLQAMISGGVLSPGDEVIFEVKSSKYLAKLSENGALLHEKAASTSTGTPVVEEFRSPSEWGNEMARRHTAKRNARSRSRGRTTVNGWADCTVNGRSLLDIRGAMMRDSKVAKSIREAAASPIHEPETKRDQADDKAPDGRLGDTPRGSGKPEGSETKDCASPVDQRASDSAEGAIEPKNEKVSEASAQAADGKPSMKQSSGSPARAKVENLETPLPPKPPNSGDAVQNHDSDVGPPATEDKQGSESPQSAGEERHANSGTTAEVTTGKTHTPADTLEKLDHQAKPQSNGDPTEPEDDSRAIAASSAVPEKTESEARAGENGDPNANESAQAADKDSMEVEGPLEADIKSNVGKRPREDSSIDHGSQREAKRARPLRDPDAPGAAADSDSSADNARGQSVKHSPNASVDGLNSNGSEEGAEEDEKPASPVSGVAGDADPFDAIADDPAAAEAAAVAAAAEKEEAVTRGRRTTRLAAGKIKQVDYKASAAAALSRAASLSGNEMDESDEEGGEGGLEAVTGSARRPRGGRRPLRSQVRDRSGRPRSNGDGKGGESGSEGGEYDEEGEVSRHGSSRVLGEAIESVVASRRAGEGGLKRESAGSGSVGSASGSPKGRALEGKSLARQVEGRLRSGRSSVSASRGGSVDGLTHESDEAVEPGDSGDAAADVCGDADEDLAMGTGPRGRGRGPVRGRGQTPPSAAEGARPRGADPDDLMIDVEGELDGGEGCAMDEDRWSADELVRLGSAMRGAGSVDAISVWQYACKHDRAWPMHGRSQEEVYAYVTGMCGFIREMVPRFGSASGSGSGDSTVRLNDALAFLAADVRRLRAGVRRPAGAVYARVWREQKIRAAIDKSRRKLKRELEETKTKLEAEMEARRRVSLECGYLELCGLDGVCTLERERGVRAAVERELGVFRARETDARSRADRARTLVEGLRAGNGADGDGGGNLRCGSESGDAALETRRLRTLIATYGSQADRFQRVCEGERARAVTLADAKARLEHDAYLARPGPQAGTTTGGGGGGGSARPGRADSARRGATVTSAGLSATAVGGRTTGAGRGKGKTPTVAPGPPVPPSLAQAAASVAAASAAAQAQTSAEARATSASGAASRRKGQPVRSPPS